MLQIFYETNNMAVLTGCNKAYYSKDDVALYIHTYGKLPPNYLTKDQAKSLVEFFS